MLKGDTFITIKTSEENSEIVTSIMTLYDTIQDKNFLIPTVHGPWVPCHITEVKVEEEQIYTVSLGQRFVEATPDTIFSTMRGAKQLKDIKNTDLLEVYDLYCEDFGGTSTAYSNVHYAECKEPIYKGFLYKLETEGHSFVRLYNGIYVCT